MGFNINSKHRQLRCTSTRYSYRLYLHYRRKVKNINVSASIQNSLSRILLAIFWRRRSFQERESYDNHLNNVKEELQDFQRNQNQQLSKLAKKLLMILTDSLISNIRNSMHEQMRPSIIRNIRTDEPAIVHLRNVQVTPFYHPYNPLIRVNNFLRDFNDLSQI